MPTLFLKDKFHIVQSKKFRYRKKIAAFDYDHTLVKPKSNGTFPKNVEDYMWLRPNVPDVVRNYYKKGYAIVIFTNQTKSWKETQIKIVLDSIDIPYRAYIAYDKSLKKPNPFMFQQYKKDNFDYKNSFFVGDALGRKGDWADSDKQFAVAAGLNIKTPEEVFPFKKSPHIKVNPHDSQEVILMMGFPGSGKTTYTKYFNHFDNYVVLHGDDLKTEAKIKRELVKELEKGKSVVVDATHSSVKKRDVFLTIAKKKALYTRIIHLNTSIEESMLRNTKREIHVPKIAFYVYRKNFQAPTYEEKVDSIITTS